MFSFPSAWGVLLRVIVRLVFRIRLGCSALEIFFNHFPISLSFFIHRSKQASYCYYYYYCYYYCLAAILDRVCNHPIINYDAQRLNNWPPYNL